MINPPPASDLIDEMVAFHSLLVRLQGAGGDWQLRPTDGEWSLTEVLCHLRDVEREVHQPRIRAILAEPSAFLPGIDADEWAEPRAYRRQDGRAALIDYLVARDETVALLRSLTADAWERQGQHTFFGPTTLREIVFLAVQHDRVHGRQIAHLLGEDDDDLHLDGQL
jgi:hypothetical protein